MKSDHTMKADNMNSRIVQQIFHIHCIKLIIIIKLVIGRTTKCAVLTWIAYDKKGHLQRFLTLWYMSMINIIPTRNYSV